jgi:hypothetical protein
MSMLSYEERKDIEWAITNYFLWLGDLLTMVSCWGSFDVLCFQSPLRDVLTLIDLQIARSCGVDVLRWTEMNAWDRRQAEINKEWTS